MHFIRFSILLFLLQSGIVVAQQRVGTVVQVRFSVPGGHYASGIRLSLFAPPGASIYYTLDGATPNLKSQRYTAPIQITETKVVRAIAYDRKQFSVPVTQTYLINEPAHGLPIVSVAMSPSTLFHPKYGIMMEGPYADPAVEHKPGANFWTRKEYLCNVEIFEDNREPVHNSPAGFRIFGGYSRVFPQKSFVLVSRKRYGSSQFEGKILPKAGLSKLKYLVLRNGGSDWNGAHFRDELMSALMDNWGVEKQAYRPAVVYLNGKYWGIYHIREKINARFLADHKLVDQDSIDLLEHRNTVRSGRVDHYNALIQYIETHDLSVPEHYARVAATIDVDNFIDYQIAQFYCVNNDAGGNIRFWRPQHKRGKWRWIFFDMDWGLGLHNPKAWQANSFRFFTEPNGPAWPNPPWSTFLLRNLLKNEQFKTRFINRMCDRLNTDFATSRVHSQIDTFVQALSPDMRRHLRKWKLSATEWNRSVETMRVFAVERPAQLRTYMEQFFALDAPADLEVHPAQGGATLVNGAVSVHNQVYHGHYYQSRPVELTAKPQSGYRFVEWEGVAGKHTTIQVQLQTGRILRVRPRFEPYTHPLTGVVMINEICPYNKKTGDWLELYNKSDAHLKLGGWSLSDGSGASFMLPDVQIAPKGFVLICRNAQKFKLKHPLVTSPIIDGMSFGLDKALETLMLTSPEGDLIDSVSYSVEPQKTDYTIDLLLPSLDNSKPNHWSVHLGPGSPGLDNPMFFAQMTGSQKEFWLRIGLGIGLVILAFAALWWRQARGR